MAVTGDTNLEPTKMELIAAVAQKELAFAAKLLPAVTDVSEFAEPGAKSIEFPKFTTSFTVQKRASTVEGTIQDLLTATDKLDLNERAYISWLVDENDRIQSRLDVQLEYARRAASAHGRQVDVDLFAEASSTAGLVIAAGALTRNTVLQGQEFLMNAVEQEEMISNSMFIVSPVQRTELLKISEFSSNEVYGRPIVPGGIIGTLYGIPVMIHRYLTGFQAYLMHKEGLAIGFQRAPAVDSQKEIGQGTGAMRWAMDQLYGCQAMQIAQAGAAAGKTPLIVAYTAV